MKASAGFLKGSFRSDGGYGCDTYAQYSYSSRES